MFREYYRDQLRRCIMEMVTIYYPSPIKDLEWRRDMYGFQLWGRPMNHTQLIHLRLRGIILNDNPTRMTYDHLFHCEEDIAEAKSFLDFYFTRVAWSYIVGWPDWVVVLAIPFAIAFYIYCINQGVHLIVAIVICLSALILSAVVAIDAFQRICQIFELSHLITLLKLNLDGSITLLKSADFPGAVGVHYDESSSASSAGTMS